VTGIRSLNKMQEGTIRITEQFSDGAPIGPSGVNSKWHNNCGVLAREKRERRFMGTDKKTLHFPY
jgi:hypothetical protein